MERSEISLFLECAFSRLEAWFQWLNKTQSGISYTAMWDAGNRLLLSDLLYLLSLFNAGEQMSSYYWRGRDNGTTLELNLNPQVQICIRKTTDLTMEQYYLTLYISTIPTIRQVNLTKTAMVMLKNRNYC